MIPNAIDINVDVGEGIGNESQLMPFISSCNIACGGHAGDSETMLRVVKLAKKHRVKIGAHPSFPDKENFGRQVMNMSCVALYTSIKNQIQDLIHILKDVHVTLNHVKPHGALYNLAAIDEKVANVIVEVIKSFVIPLKLYVPYDSVIARIAKQNNIQIIYEAFADRNYNDDLTLVSRKENNAVIDDANALFEHVYYMILNEKVKTLNGNSTRLVAETFCIHGDNPNAVNLISDLTNRLKALGIKIR